MNEKDSKKELRLHLNAEMALRNLSSSLTDPYSTYSIRDEFERLQDIYKSGNETTRYFIVSELISVGYNKITDFLLYVLENDKSPLIRHEAAFGLGNFGDSKTSQYLVKTMLKDPNEMVRHEAAIALAYSGSRDSLSYLEKATNDPYQPVRASARFAIRYIKRRISRDKKIGRHA